MGDQLSTIRQLVLDRMAASAVDPLYDPAIVDRTINATNKRLGREFDWPWLQTTTTLSFAATVGTYDLTTVTNFRHFKYVGVGNRKLKSISAGEMLAYTGQSGPVPSFYSTVKDTLTIALTPSEAVTLNVAYLVDENDLTDDGSTCLLPSAYTELLVLKTCISLSQRANNSARMAMFKAEYKDAIVEARDEVRRTRDLLRISVDESLWRTA